MNHTKGEWRIQEQFEAPLFISDENGNEWYYLSCYIFGDNKLIGTVDYQTETPGWARVDKLSEMRANAKLIASAPELLEACITVEKLYSELEIMIDGEVYEMLTQVRQAIKKATS